MKRKQPVNRKYVLVGILLAGILFGSILWISAIPQQTTQKTQSQLDQEYSAMLVPAPEGINLTGFEGDMESRRGQCIYNSILFGHQNPGWTIVSANKVVPTSNEQFSHMFTVKGDVVFDPTPAVFYDKPGFYKFYQISNVTEYYSGE